MEIFAHDLITDDAERQHQELLNVILHYIIIAYGEKQRNLINSKLYYN